MSLDWSSSIPDNDPLRDGVLPRESMGGIALADIELSEMIIELRKTLERAQKEGEGKSIQFLVNETELEAFVKMTHEGEGGFKFVVVEGGGKIGTEQSQRVTIKLQPFTWIDGKPKRVTIADLDTK